MSQRGSAPHRASLHSSSTRPPSPEDGRALAATGGGGNTSGNSNDNSTDHIHASSINNPASTRTSPTHLSSSSQLPPPYLRDDHLLRRDMLSAEQGGHGHGHAEGGSGGAVAPGTRGLAPSERSIEAAGVPGIMGGMAAARRPSYPDERGVQRTTPPRAFGVHNILNPSDSGGGRAEREGGGGGFGDSRPLPRTRPASDMSHFGGAGGGADSTGSSSSISQQPYSGQYGPPSRPYLYADPSAGGSPRPALLPGGREQSPSLSQLYQPPGGAPRRILTPKSPRRVSASRNSSFGGSSQSYGPHGQHGAGPADAPPVPPLPSPLRPPSAMGAMATPPRSFSHPAFVSNPGGPGQTGPPSLHMSEAAQQQQQQQQQQQGHQVSAYQLHEPHRQSLGGYGTNPTSSQQSGRPGGDGGWGMPGMQGGGSRGVGGLAGARSVSMAEGQQFIMITPSVGDEIQVPVDVHQASKQADEKRQRNAGASARFRARKKEKDREVQMVMQKLETMNRDLSKRLQDTELRCDFYRNERNRLWQAILQNPSMRDQVEPGPPSPGSSMMGGSYMAENSPMSSASAPQTQYSNPIPQQPPLQPPHPTVAYPPLHQSVQPHGPPHHLSHISTGGPGSGPSAAGLRGPDSPYGGERPARRRRTDSGPTAGPAAGFHTAPSPYGSPMTTALPPLPTAGFHSLTPSPLSGSPNNPNTRLPPLRMENAGPSSVGAGGGLGGSAGRDGAGGGESGGGFASASPTPEPGSGPSGLPPATAYPPMSTTAMAGPPYSRTYETAGWATDTPSPHHHDLGHQR